MLRLFSAPSVAAVLGLGGLAMAQDDLIVDPWKRAVSSVLESRRTTAPANDRTRPVGVASFRVDDEPGAKTGPAVVPLGPPLNLAVDPWAVVPVEPTFSDRVVDPWAGSRLSSSQTARVAAMRRGHSDWAREIDEIIDPWAKGPLAVVTDPLIIDPWAR
jgi:hypothetical protein